MISTLIFSGAPLNQQIWGCFGRNTGFLTYFSLLGIAISTALIQKPDFYRSITHSLLITAVPVTIYCLIQMTGNDPVGWSSLATFARGPTINKIKLNRLYKIWFLMSIRVNYKFRKSRIYLTKLIYFI